MYKEIIPLLKCPNCHKKLHIKSIETEKKEDIISGILICDSRHEWVINQGILIFNVEEQKDANRWSEILQGRSLREFDNWVLEKTPQNQIELTNKAINDVIGFIKEKKPKLIIDIATGRGQLVNKIAEEITHPYHLVCTDLSPFVLKQDRKNLVSDISSQKLSYIACDASNLPFENKSFEFATSLMGIMNMRDLIRKGITQVKRILEESGIFINTVLTIKKNSKSYNVYKKFLEKDDVRGIENYMLSPVIESLHKEIGFRKVEKKSIGESVAKENELDLIPVEGDWFSIENIYAYN